MGTCSLRTPETTRCGCSVWTARTGALSDGRGRGPGEFRNIYSIAWVGDRLLTFDPPLGRLGAFSAEGEWLGQRRTEAAGLTGSAADIRLYPVGANEVFRFGARLGARF